MGLRFVLVFLVLSLSLCMVTIHAMSDERSDALNLKRPKIRLVRGLVLMESTVSSIADPPATMSTGGGKAAEEGEDVAEAPESRWLGHHSTDKSMAGGGVIIGGLFIAIFAAVFCYIRVTRKRDGEKH